MSGKWIYLFGERNGVDIKIGETKASRADIRLGTVNGDQTTMENYVCLAAAVGATKDETRLKEYFGHLQRQDKGTRKEYFRPEPELVEYAAWLRAQWFVSPDGEDEREGFDVVDPTFWTPDPYRRMSKPPDDPTKFIQDYDTWGGPLAGTAWSWLPNPKASVQDYFTPPEIVDAAREGMGGIDLDAAGHPRANRELRIPRIFLMSYSAFDNDWEGKVWLNPPYGENDRWWPRVMEFVDSGQVEQICILSPVWAFTTQIARPLMERADAMLLLEPTPKFWGNSEGRTGTNNPHAIVYIGDRRREVLGALSSFGIPMTLQLDALTPQSAGT